MILELFKQKDSFFPSNEMNRRSSEVADATALHQSGTFGTAALGERNLIRNLAQKLAEGLALKRLLKGHRRPGSSWIDHILSYQSVIPWSSGSLKEVLKCQMHAFY